MGERISYQWVGRLDLLQSVSGLILALFMWVHMCLVSSILISKDAMYMVAKMFEGYYFFGRAYPQLVAGAVMGVFLLMVLHAALAMRKFPHDYQQYTRFRQHQHRFAHSDTSLWWWQIVSGFLLFFLAPMHLFGMFSQPDQIGPHMSSLRVYNTHWPLYLVLLFAVELHAALGIYRLILKWCSLPTGKDAKRWRHQLTVFKWGMSIFFIALGLATLLAYYQLGHHLHDQPFNKYDPSVSQPMEVR